MLPDAIGHSVYPSGGKRKGTVRRAVCVSAATTEFCRAGLRCAYGKIGEKPFLSEAPNEQAEDIRYAIDYLCLSVICG